MTTIIVGVVVAKASVRLLEPAPGVGWWRSFIGARHAAPPHKASKELRGAKL